MVNGERNYRWDFIRSGYQVCVARDGKRDWFLLNAPKRSHKGLAVSASITCQHVCSLLSKKNLFLTFDDTNGIVTRLYVEGEYGDHGYVGIDDVNPTGLPYLMNFDYFRQLGLFTAEHEQA